MVLCTCLHDLTGVEQRIASAYHPQSNGLVERQNRTMKKAFVKVLDAHLEERRHIIEGVLFVHRVSRHLSITYTPFFFFFFFWIYNRDSVLSLDVKFSLAESEVNETEVFDEETFEAILASAVHKFMDLQLVTKEKLKTSKKRLWSTPSFQQRN